MKAKIKENELGKETQDRKEANETYLGISVDSRFTDDRVGDCQAKRDGSEQYELLISMVKATLGKQRFYSGLLSVQSFSSCFW